MSAYWANKISDNAKRAGGRVTGSDKDATVAAYQHGQSKTCDHAPDRDWLRQPSQCGKIVHFSIFFDGTNNHLDWDAPSANAQAQPTGLALEDLPRNKKDANNATHSNIARLFRAAQTKSANPNEEYQRLYVPGVGTPFQEVGEHVFSGSGKAFATGLEARVSLSKKHNITRTKDGYSNCRL